MACLLVTGYIQIHSKKQRVNAEPNYTYSVLLLLPERYSRFKVTRMLKKFGVGGGEVVI